MKKIIERYSDDYLRELCIHRHLIECMELFKLYILDKSYENGFKLNKELMDLHILLEVHKRSNIKMEELHLDRITKFETNIRKSYQK